MKMAEKLLKDIKEEVNSWDQISQFKLKNVDLSPIQLAMLEIYAEKYISNGGNGFPGLIGPIGVVRKVLERYDLIHQKVSV